jgi:hypothetical protein
MPLSKSCRREDVLLAHMQTFNFLALGVWGLEIGTQRKRKRKRNKKSKASSGHPVKKRPGGCQLLFPALAAGPMSHVSKQLLLV